MSSVVVHHTCTPHAVHRPCEFGVSRQHHPCACFATDRTNTWQPRMICHKQTHSQLLVSSVIFGLAKLRKLQTHTSMQVVRKERAVGVIPQTSTIYEVLEELAIAVQVHAIANAPSKLCLYALPVSLRSI